MSRSLFKRAVPWVTSLIVVIVAALTYLHGKVTKFRLTFVPESWGVSEVLYAKSKSWGWGPGNAEVGITIYRLPETLAVEVQDRGRPYLLSLDEGSNWTETPPTGRDWECNIVECPAPGRLTVLNYLAQGDLGLSVPRALVDELDQALAKPGSYFAYQRVGLLVVAPHERKIYHLFRKF